MNGTSKNTSWWQKIVLLTVSVLIGLGLCELIVRSLKLGPQVIQQVGVIRFVDNLNMVYELVPGAHLFNNVINKQGFNDADFTIEKPKNLIRIAMLGDSITQGIYVSRGKTFSDKLEELLNRKAQKSHSRLKYEVMNFGVVGYNLTAEVEILKEKVLAYEPDIVILNLFKNDNELIPGSNPLFHDNILQLTEQQQIALVRKYVAGRNSWIRRFERNVLYKSRFYLLLVDALDKLRTDRLQESDLINMEGNAAEDMTLVLRSFQDIDKLKKQYGFKLLICLHPSLLFEESSVMMKFADAADPFHFNYFRMFPYYKKENLSPESLQVKVPGGDNCHPNELGHELIAKALFAELTRYHLIDL
jgi:lysophospholipase L1-like esterase